MRPQKSMWLLALQLRGRLGGSWGLGVGGCMMRTPRHATFRVLK